MKRILTSLLICLVFLVIYSSCSTEAHPISYGSDACHFCMMTIVDKQHAAQIVTKKGKPFKYDAIECMMNDLKRREDGTIALYLVSDYSKPGRLIDARLAHFIISEAIPSPMGEFLSAFSEEEKAKEKVTNLGGMYYDWAGLIEEFE